MLHLDWFVNLVSIGTNRLVVRNQGAFHLNAHLGWQVVKPASEFIIQPTMNRLQTKLNFLVEDDVGSVVVAISYKANAFPPEVFDVLAFKFQFDLVCSHYNIIYAILLRNFIINEQLYKNIFKWYNILKGDGEGNATSKEGCVSFAKIL